MLLAAVLASSPVRAQVFRRTTRVELRTIIQIAIGTN